MSNIISIPLNKLIQPTYGESIDVPAPQYRIAGGSSGYRRHEHISLSYSPSTARHSIPRYSPSRRRLHTPEQACRRLRRDSRRNCLRNFWAGSAVQRQIIWWGLARGPRCNVSIKRSGSEQLKEGGKYNRDRSSVFAQFASRTLVACDSQAKFMRRAAVVYRALQNG
jgi:hypothetical protein